MTLIKSLILFSLYFNMFESIMLPNSCENILIYKIKIKVNIITVPIIYEFSAGTSLLVSW